MRSSYFIEGLTQGLSANLDAGAGHIIRAMLLAADREGGHRLHWRAIRSLILREMLNYRPDDIDDNVATAFALLTAKADRRISRAYHASKLAMTISDGPKPSGLRLAMGSALWAMHFEGVEVEPLKVVSHCRDLAMILIAADTRRDMARLKPPLDRADGLLSFSLIRESAARSAILGSLAMSLKG